MILPGTITIEDQDNVTEPVTKAQVKAYAVIDSDDTSYDALITDMIPAAREVVESLSNLALVPKVVSFSIKDCKSAYLPYSNGEVTVTAVSDTDNEDEVLPVTEYKLKQSGKVLEVDYKGNYAVSYTITPKVPASLKEAVIMLVVYRLRNRGDQQAQHGVPDDILGVIKGKKVIWL